jgi:3-hydroxyisobutyrate dehydrogenase-like beta-hydroxyacid dehydrogenase
MTEHTSEIYQKMISNGMGDREISELVRLYR